MKILLFVLISAFSLCSQTDLNRWGKADFHYSREVKESKHTSSDEGTGIGNAVLKSAITVYWVTFSDVDGDNCPFTPTCSSFLLQSTRKTNLVQGTLMFFDRFTRDMNVFERFNHYPVIEKEKFYDPTELYTLKEEKTREALREMYQHNGKK